MGVGFTQFAVLVALQTTHRLLVLPQTGVLPLQLASVSQSRQVPAFGPAATQRPARHAEVDGQTELPCKSPQRLSLGSQTPVRHARPPSIALQVPPGSAPPFGMSG